MIKREILILIGRSLVFLCFLMLEERNCPINVVGRTINFINFDSDDRKNFWLKSVSINRC